MFCPQCKTEYRNNLVVCRDCNVSLVKKLPNESPKKSDDIGFEIIFSTPDIGAISLIKSVFENEGIKYFFQGENMVHLRSIPANLMVRKDQVEEATKVLKELLG